MPIIHVAAGEGWEALLPPQAGDYLGMPGDPPGHAWQQTPAGLWWRRTRHAPSAEAALLLAALSAAWLPAPEVEVLFVPGRDWRADLAWPDRGLLVEVQGGTFSGGAHTRGVGYSRDCERLAEAHLLGWRMFWLPTDWITKQHADRAVRLVTRILQESEK